MADFREQLQTARNTLDQARALFEEGEKERQAGTTAQENGQWAEALACYERACNYYLRAQRTVRSLSQTGITPIASLRQLYREAESLLKQTDLAKAQVESSSFMGFCQARLSEAAQKIEAARQALTENRFADAIDFAEEAKQLNPGLFEAVAQIQRDAEQASTNRNFPLWLTVLIVLLLLGAFLICLFGSGLWDQVQKLFF